MRRLVCTLVLLLLVGQVIAIEEDLADFGAELETLAPTEMEERGVPGMALALIQGGEIVWSGNYGVADVESQTPVTDETVFNVASMGKAVTAWAILTLVEDGTLDLDTPVDTYLTRWHLPDDERNGGVTIRRILSHTAGLSVAGYFGFNSPDDLPTIEDVLAGNSEAGNTVEVIFEPGTRFSYSGGGFVILQLVIEEVTGMSFADYAQQAVLEPLGMSHSDFAMTDEILTNIATGYDDDGNPRDTLYFTTQAAGGFNTTAQDLAVFVAAHFPTGDEPAGRGVISSEHVDELFVPQEASGDEYSYGYFIHTLAPRSEDVVVWHDGFNRGWRALFAIFPTHDIGVVMLTNSEQGYFVMTQLSCALDEFTEADLRGFCRILGRFQG